MTVTDYLATFYGRELMMANGYDPLGDWSKLQPYLDHLSPSSLTMFRRCPRQFQERYIFGRKERPAEAPVIGTAVHAGLERNFEQKIRSGEDLPMAELLGWYSDVGFDTVVEIEQERSESEVVWDSEDGSPEPAKLRGRVMLGAYHELVSPRIMPVATEGSFSINLGAPVPIVGRYDVVREESAVDIKTGKRKQTKPKEAWRMQAAIYREATGLPVEFHSLTASGKTATIVTPLESEEMLVAPSDSERNVLRENIRFIAAQIQLCMELYGPEAPWPTEGRFHDWACSYCGFRSTCPAWASERE